jgi:1-acyl-sn-glycerol-3-phosphate acyltransferase
MISRSAARLVLRVTRWRVGGSAPSERKYVLIAAPHTSNWDLLYLLAIASDLGVKISWLGKDSLFKGPMGWVLRRLGGVPVPRGQRSGMVDALVAEFERAESLVIVIPPEATRGHTDHWKSGFYRIASAAGVPIVCGYLDYGRRVGGFGQVVWPTSDLDADIAVFRRFYADKAGKFPDGVGDIRLRTQDADLPA